MRRHPMLGFSSVVVLPTLHANFLSSYRCTFGSLTYLRLGIIKYIPLELLIARLGFASDECIAWNHELAPDDLNSIMPWIR